MLPFVNIRPMSQSDAVNANDQDAFNSLIWNEDK